MESKNMTVRELLGSFSSMAIAKINDEDHLLANHIPEIKKAIYAFKDIKDKNLTLDDAVKAINDKYPDETRSDVDQDSNGFFLSYFLWNDDGKDD